jgi:cytoskeletal protein CcmA (bactofilin family)
MSDTPKRRLRDQFGASPSFIAEGAQFVGSLVTHGAVVVCGRVEGDGRIGGALSLARDAEWVGNIHAREAVIAGRVTGDLQIDAKLEIGASAVIAGRVTARTLAIASGAVIESEVTVTSGEPVLHFEEQREEE